MSVAAMLVRSTATKEIDYSREIVDAEEGVLSEVHIGPKPLELKQAPGIFVTRFTFSDPEQHIELNSLSELELDEDGDFILPRRAPAQKQCITIAHKMDTIIPDVGFQVWRGALLLADFILAAPRNFNNKRLLELGCGSGLAGIVAARKASAVFLTDYSDAILENCRRNLELNCLSETNMTIRRLDLIDWRHSLHPNIGGPFSWSNEDLVELDDVSVVIGADIVYNDELTDGIFAFLEQFLMQKEGRKAFLSLEKRIVFTLEGLCVAAPAYDHFRSKFVDFDGTSMEMSNLEDKLCGRRVMDEIPPAFDCYDRVPELEIWEFFSLNH